MMLKAKMEDKIKLAELLVEEEMLEEEQEIQYKQLELQRIQQKEHELKQMEQELKIQQQELQHIMVQLQIRKKLQSYGQEFLHLEAVYKSQKTILVKRQSQSLFLLL